MQVRDSSGLRGDRALVFLLLSVALGLQTKSFADFGRLRFQGVGLRALLGEGVSGGANPILGGGGGLEEGRLLLELGSPIVVGRAGSRGLVLEALGGCEGSVAQLGCVGGGDGSSRGAGAGAVGASHGANAERERGRGRERREGSGSRGSARGTGP